MRYAEVPARPQAVAQLQPHAWVARNVAYVARVHAVLGNDRQAFANASVAHWSTAWLSRLLSRRFEQCIPRGHKADSEQNFDRWIQKIFLKQVNNPMLHLLVLTNSVKPIAVPTAQQNPNHLRSLRSSRIPDCTILGELTREVFRRRFAPKRRSRNEHRPYEETAGDRDEQATRAREPDPPP